MGAMHVWVWLCVMVLNFDQAHGGEKKGWSLQNKLVHVKITPCQIIFGILSTHTQDLEAAKDQDLFNRKKAEVALREAKFMQVRSDSVYVCVCVCKRVYPEKVCVCVCVCVFD